MSEIQVSAWRVDIIESESGWGSKIDETKYFDSEQAAKDFVESYNAKDDEPITPYWYMYAQYLGKV